MKNTKKTAVCCFLAVFGLIGTVRAQELLPATEAELRYSKEMLEHVLSSSDEDGAHTVVGCALDVLEERTLDPNVCGDSGLAQLSRSNQVRRVKRIVNGVATHHYPAAGVLLKGLTPGTASVQCSGTLIAPNKFLTAAHCIAPRAITGAYWVFFLHAGSRGVVHIAWPKQEYREKGDAADLAVLTLKTPVHVIKPTPINDRVEVIPGIEGVIVGFGRTGGSERGGDVEDYGIKRIGYVETDKCRDDLDKDAHICWNFDTLLMGSDRRSNTCNADSGGGLMNLSGVSFLIGITTAGENEDCGLDDHSWDLDIFHWKDWINAQLENASAARSDVVTVDPNRHVFGDVTALGVDTPPIDYDISVQPGTSRLAVALNGEDDGRGANDFDLFLMEGSQTPIEEAACKQDAEGQFAYCEVAAPKPGPWRVVLQAKRGKGLAQLTVTTTE